MADAGAPARSDGALGHPRGHTNSSSRLAPQPTAYNIVSSEKQEMSPSSSNNNCVVADDLFQILTWLPPLEPGYPTGAFKIGGSKM